MKILLINNNPVVSRLTALSARKEDIEIDEIQEMTELNATKYDIVFVDADSLSKDVENAISDNINAQKKVLFYAQDDREDSSSFDMSILKPFLPSEVSAVIRSIDESEIEEIEIKEEKAVSENIPEAKEPEVEKSVEEKHFDVLAEVQETKRDELFDLDLSPVKQAETDELTEALDKIDLTDEMSPESFDAKLQEAFPAKSIDLDDELFTDITDDSDKKLDEKLELFEIDLNDDKTSLNEELFVDEKKESSDELFDFDFEKSEELDFEKLDNVDVKIENNIEEEKTENDTATTKPSEMEVSKVEEKEEVQTQVLDESEISNIKDLLENKEEVVENVELEDLMATATPVMATENIYMEDSKEEKELKKEASSDDTVNIDSNTAVETLGNLPIESLRELLAGARINISIKFPKAK